MNNIAVIGTGSAGTARMWDGQIMQRGNHLRWFFESSMGFPDLGFDLYRRESTQINELQFEELRIQLETIPSPSLNIAGQITVRSINQTTNLSIDSDPLGLRIIPSFGIEMIFQNPIYYLRIEVRIEQDEEGKSLGILGSFKGNKVFSTEITSSKLIQYPGRLDKIDITGNGWITLFNFESRVPDQGWGFLKSIGLPVTHSQYPYRNPRADGTIIGDEAEAKTRLPQVSEILDRYVNGVAGTITTRKPFQDELHPELLSLATHNILPPPLWTNSSSPPTTAAPPKLEPINHLDYILLAALDPYLACILGLYYVDTEPSVSLSSRFDYKIEGHWLENRISTGQIHFSDLPRIAGSQELWYYGFRFASSVEAQLRGNEVVFEGSNVNIRLELPQAFKITSVSIFGEIFGGFYAVSTYSDGSTKQRGLNATLFTQELATFEGKELQSIEIIGNGRITLKDAFYESETSIVSYSAIAYYLSPADSLPIIQAPKSLSTWELVGWALSQSADAIGLNAVGLHWNLDLDHDENGEGLVPPTSPLIAVEWYNFNMLPSESPPIATGTERFKFLNDNHPVLAMPIKQSPSSSSSVINNNISNEEIQRRAALEFLIKGLLPANPLQPQPPVDTLNYLHTRLPDGWYGYRLRSIDVFGRVSSSNTQGKDIKIVGLQNKFKPHPPLLLDARYIQPDDPPRVCNTEENAWLQSHPGKYGLRVRWTYPPSLYHRSPKALTFRIYGPGMEAQPITVGDPETDLSGSVFDITSGVTGSITQVLNLVGMITQLEPVGKIVNKLMTNAVLPHGNSDIFAGALLKQGNNSYKILGHTDNANVVIWIERELRQLTSDPEPVPDPAPTVGPFTVDHSLVKTNIPFHKGGELTVGGSLDVNGIKSIVIKYMGGSEFLVRHGLATLPPSITPPPSTGEFSLLPFAGGSNGISATIESIVAEDNGIQTSIVEVKVKPPNLPIPAGSILAGGVVTDAASSNSFRILENTGSESTSGSAQLTLKWNEVGNTHKKPNKGSCTVKAPFFATLEADRVLPGLITSSTTRKIGGWLEQDSSKEFSILGVWKDISSTSAASSKTYFLVSYQNGTSAPTSGNFTYHPVYEIILEIPPEVNNASVVEVVTLEALIRKIEIDTITGHLTITTDLDLACQRTIFNGGKLQAGGNTYKILKAISLSPVILVIEKPDASNPQLAINSKYVVSGSDGDIAVVKTSKAGKRWRWFMGGVLEQTTKKFIVIGHTGDANLLVNNAGGTIPALGAFAYHPVDSNNEPTAQGSVSVTVQDPNGESAHTVPLTVTAVYRMPPSPPLLSLIPPDSGCIMAEPADWYGRSSYTLSWPANQGLIYNVYRALDESIYDADRMTRAASSQLRPSITVANLPVRLQSDPQRSLILQAIQQDLNNLDTKIVAWKDALPNEKTQRLAELEQVYKNLRNDTHEVLANMQHVMNAFALITEYPINSKGLTASFQDKLPGYSSNRFFYRIASVDSGDNISTLSYPSPPICCPDIVPPKRPVLLEAANDEKVITLTWVRNTEADLDHYLLYKTDSLEAAQDRRNMELHKLIAKSPSVILRSGEVAPETVAGRANLLQIADTVNPSMIYYYRLVAVDTSENLSESSVVVSGRAYQLLPSPPIWNQPERKPTSNPIFVLLSWTHPTDQYLACLVERHMPGIPRWISVSGWLPHGVYTFQDTPPDITTAWEYRLRVRDQLGQMANTMPTTLLPVEGAL
jgi:hypothetical protein